MTEYPHAIDPEMVGEYPATAKSGGGHRNLHFHALHLRRNPTRRLHHGRQQRRLHGATRAYDCGHGWATDCADGGE